MKGFNALKTGVTRVVQACVLLVAVVVVVPLLPILLVGAVIAGVWRRVDRWRYRRGFESRFRPYGKRAVFVYSNSPHWKDRIESEVLPLIADQVVLLNWSERSTERWKERPLEVRIFEQWGGRTAFNPLAVVFPVNGPAEVVRFWQAYKDHKHGKPRLLREREKQLFDLLDVPEAERPGVEKLPISW